MEVNVGVPTVRSRPLQRLVKHIKRVVHLGRVRSIYPLDLRSQFKVDLQEWVNSNDGTSRENKLRAKAIIMRILRSRETRLYLSELSLHTIPPLYALGHLTYLNLSNNNIQHIEPCFFSHLSNLTYLCLYNNHIQYIPSLTFSDLTNLQILSLDRNDLQDISPLAFSNLTNLDTLSLESNHIHTIDSQLFSDLENLQFLYISRNNLNSIDPLVFSNLTRLKTLDLAYNHISSIDSQFFSNLENLEYLCINNNGLNSIDPMAFSHLTRLRTILLNHNNLYRIDARLWTNLHELQHIRLQNNGLTQFEWPTNNRSHPLVVLVRNHFSEETRRELLSQPNHPRYVFETAFEWELARTRERSGVNLYYMAEPTLKDLTRILDRWGVSTTGDLHEFIINEKDPDKMREYTNLVLFFNRFFLGLTVSQSIYKIVREIWMTLENQFPDTQLLDMCVLLATDGVSSCTDRTRLCLIQMSLNCSLCDAKRVENQVKIEECKHQLELMNRVIRFVSDVNDYKIVYSLNKKKFLPLHQFYPDGVDVDHMEDKVDVNCISAYERNELVAQLSSRKKSLELKLFDIRDEVEDILLIANTLSHKGLAKFDDVGMLNRSCTSLHDYLTSAIRYIENSSKL